MTLNEIFAFLFHILHLTKDSASLHCYLCQSYSFIDNRHNFDFTLCVQPFEILFKRWQ